MRRTFRYRLYPTARQAAALTLQLGEANRMIETTTRPFPEAFADLRRSAGVTFGQLAERTRSLDPAGKGLSHGDVARLVNGDEPLNPHARKLIGAAFGELVRPEYFVEYRMAQLRPALDRQSGDSS